MTARESGLNPTRAKQFERTPRQDEGDLNGVVGLAGNSDGPNRGARWDPLPAVKAAFPSPGNARQARLQASWRQGRCPKGERNGAYRTGHYTAGAKAERRQTRALIRELRRLAAMAAD